RVPLHAERRLEVARVHAEVPRLELLLRQPLRQEHHPVETDHRAPLLVVRRRAAALARHAEAGGANAARRRPCASVDLAAVTSWRRSDLPCTPTASRRRRPSARRPGRAACSCTSTAPCSG